MARILPLEREQHAGAQPAIAHQARFRRKYYLWLVFRFGSSPLTPGIATTASSPATSGRDPVAWPSHPGNTSRAPTVRTKILAAWPECRRPLGRDRGPSGCSPAWVVGDLG
jgi:hypothetical protein